MEMPVRFIIDELVAIDRENRIAELERQVQELTETLGRLTDALSVDEENQLTIRATGIEIESDADLKIEAAGNLEISAGGNLDVSAAAQTSSVAMARFSGIIQCETITATTVIGSNYTPGAGNVM
jgi:hypothetical protein